MDLKNWVLKRHDYWWAFLMQRFRWALEDVTAPKVEFYSRVGGKAGSGNKKVCRFNLAYVATVPREEFDWTVCHECCHSLALRLMPDGALHGELWTWLYRDVCESKRGRHHAYSVGVASKAAPAIRKLTKLAKKMKGLKP